MEICPNGQETSRFQTELSIGLNFYLRFKEVCRFMGTFERSLVKDEKLDEGWA
jgi:hypothetical protein